MAPRALTPRPGKITGLGVVCVPKFHRSAGVTSVTWHLSVGWPGPGTTTARHAHDSTPDLGLGTKLWRTSGNRSNGRDHRRNRGDSRHNNPDNPSPSLIPLIQCRHMK